MLLGTVLGWLGNCGVGNAAMCGGSMGARVRHVGSHMVRSSRRSVPPGK